MLHLQLNGSEEESRELGSERLIGVRQTCYIFDCRGPMQQKGCSGDREEFRVQFQFSCASKTMHALLWFQLVLFVGSGHCVMHIM